MRNQKYLLQLYGKDLLVGVISSFPQQQVLSLFLISTSICIYFLQFNLYQLLGNLSQQMEERQSFTTASPSNRTKFVNLLFVNTELKQTTFKKTIIFYIIMAVIFITLSIVLFILMNSVREVSAIYYTPIDKTLCSTGQNCTVNLKVEQYMKAPVYFMYQIGNFYQNHRRYIQSKSNFQLGGNQITTSTQAQVCWPFITNAQMNVSLSWGGQYLNENDTASPCGAIAKTFFNDTFQLFFQGNRISINQTGISWPGDKGYKYKRAPNSQNTQWVDPQNEHFIVWMRTSGLPDFRKLWGRIQTDLQPGNYEVIISNNYNSSSWEGNRYVHLTTKTIFGGKNFLLPSAFIVLGVACIIASLFFFKKWKSNQGHSQ